MTATLKVKSTTPNRRKSQTPTVPRTHKPERMTLVEWQSALRRQFGRESVKNFNIRNTGDAAVFSEYAVTNRESGRTYRVDIRGTEPGKNFCTCADFAVNTLGTCKHIEGVLHRLRQKSARALAQGFTPPFAELFVRYGVRRTLEFSPGAGCPSELTRLAESCFGDGAMREEAGYPGFDRFVERAAKIDHDLRIYDDAKALVAEARDRAARESRFSELYTGRGGSAAWKKLLKVPLFPYQREGALFAAKAGRAIIADEMGLGKTIQGLAAAEILARDGGVERVLIVCPASLKSQWKQEIAKFTDRTATIIEGLSPQRRAGYQWDTAFYKIANYDVIDADIDTITRWSPDLVILDEAQRIKNWQTRAAKAVKRITARSAIVLTGTPLENRLDELHSIVEFVDRFRLGPLFAFKAAHETHEEGSTKVVGYHDLNKIQRTLAPILIRRTKKEVLSQLPERMDKNFFVPMTDPQWEYHRENRDTVVRLVSKWRTHKFLTDADQLKLRIALQNMRMSCDSTYLLDHETKHGTKVDELGDLLEEVFEDRANKVVIFSQWVRMNELIEEMLEKRGWGHVHLHGGVPSAKRSELTQALREDVRCKVFLSTDAGGVGLNLQTASTVVNMDLPWNPAVLEQRIGRVHRLGQERPVRVVNFIAEDTIEHGMLSLLSFKQSMFTGVLDGAADKVFMGDSAMSRFMKTVERATESAPTAPQPATVVVPSKQSARVEQVAPSSIDGTALAGILVQGAQWLQSIAAMLSTPTEPAASKNGRHRPRIVTEPQSGQQELRLPLPSPQTLTSLAQAFSGILGNTPERILKSVEIPRSK